MKRLRWPWSIRLSQSFEQRLRAFAAEHSITPTAALRLAAQRGLAVLEDDSSRKASPAPPPPPPPAPAPAVPEPTYPGRRVVSRGIF